MLLADEAAGKPFGNPQAAKGGVLIPTTDQAGDFAFALFSYATKTGAAFQPPGEDWMRLLYVLPQPLGYRVALVQPGTKVNPMALLYARTSFVKYSDITPRTFRVVYRGKVVCLVPSWLQGGDA